MTRHGVLVRAILVGFVALVLLFAGVVPLIGKSRTLARKVETRRSDAEEIATRVAVLSGLDRDVLKSRMEIIDKALPPKKDVLLYLSSIDGLSRELGLTFSGISVSPGEVTEASPGASVDNKKVRGDDAMPGVHSLETEVKINGNRENIYSFLRLVEQSLPLMQIKDVSMTASGIDSYLLTVRLAMLWAAPSRGELKGAITLFNEKEENYFQQLASYRKFVPVQLSTAPSGGGKGDLFAPSTVIPEVQEIVAEEASPAAILQ